MLRSVVLIGLMIMGLEASAQVTGHVEDDLGQPMPNAIVAVIGHDRLLDEVATDRTGVFLSDVRLPDVRRLSVHYIGYATSVLDASTLRAEGVRVVMDPLPVRLPGIVAHITRDVCSERDDPRARALWEAAKSRYSDETAWRGGAISGLGQASYVRSDALGSYDPKELIPMTSGWAGAAEGPYPLHLETQIEQPGYAWSRSEDDRKSIATARRHLNWAYPEFERRHAYHFATLTFSERHTLHLIGDSPGGTEIVYCPLPRDGAEMRGRLTIAQDTTFAEARWSIQTDDPFEDASGEIVFADAFDAAGARHLVSARGTFWRHNGRAAPYPDLPRSYTQIVRVAREWVICTDSRAPKDWVDRSRVTSSSLERASCVR